MSGDRARVVGRVLASLALIALAGGSAGCVANAPGSGGSGNAASVTVGPSGTITREQAVAAAEAFLGRKLANPTVGDPADDPNGYYQVAEEGTDAAPGVVVEVDPATGRVISMIALGEVAPGVNITEQQAIAAAQKFLTAHGVPFDGMEVTVELVDHGAAQQFYVTWQRYVDGAAVPDSRAVTVDGRTGEVVSFVDFRRPYGPVAGPKIGREDAIRLATQKSGLTTPKISKVELAVIPVGEWAGRTAWSVQLSAEVPIPGSSSGYISAFWIYVDATTGETLIYGQG